jgi:hypothetical protein
VRFSTCEARVARRRENTGERRHTGQIFFAGGMSACVRCPPDERRAETGNVGADKQKAGLLHPAFRLVARSPTAIAAADQSCVSQ